jgi:hypothetical protein
MSDNSPVEQPTAPADADVRSVMRQVIEEFVRTEQQKAEPAYRTELIEERKKREALESRLNQLVDENRRAHAAAEEADRNAQIRAELQKLGVAKVDLAFRAVKDDISRSTDGRLVANDGQEQRPVTEFLKKFVDDNPELLPARMSGGSGAHSTTRNAVSAGNSSIDIDRIKPGMNKEEMDRIRQEIARIASQSLRGM